MSYDNLIKSGGAEMKKILVPIDGSEYSNLAIDKAKELAEKFDSEIILLHVNDVCDKHFYLNPFVSEATPSFFDNTKSPKMSPIIVPQEYIEEIEKAIENILKRAKERCSDSNINVSAIALKGKPAEVITEYAENNNIDLVVMGSHGLSGFKRFFVGSITHKVLMSIKKPMLIVR